MGLMAGSKSRRKISRDPNNTKWSRDTTTFGQRILRAQGWEPGQYLGAQNAAHSELYTAANASSIRVSLKDDVQGLGYSMAKGDPVTGLDVFSDLLSRLNGKSEEAVEGQRQARLEMKTNLHVQLKWGPMRFVKGGLLVGENMKEVGASGDTAMAPENGGPDGVPTAHSKKDKKSKKRKVADVEDRDMEEPTSRKERKRQREGKVGKVSPEVASDGDDGIAPTCDKRSRKKSRKEKSLAGKDGRRPEKTSLSLVGNSDQKESKTSKDGKREKKKRKKVDAELTEGNPPESSEQREAATGVSTPTDTGTGTSTPMGGRNFARSRFIAAKRQAMLDSKALNQIFMIKT